MLKFNLIDNARELAGKGRLDQAMSQLDKLATQLPEPAGVERLRGIIFYQREQLFPKLLKPSAKPPRRIPATANPLKCTA